YFSSHLLTLIPRSTPLSLTTRRPPRSPLFPYTTLFRSCSTSRSSRISAPTSSTPPAPPEPPRACRSRTATCCRCSPRPSTSSDRSEEHTSELQSRENLVCRLLLEKKKQM